MSDNENNGPVTVEQGGGGDLGQVTKMKDDVVTELKANAAGDNGMSEDQPEETEDKTQGGKMEVDAEERPETKDEPEPVKTPAKRGRKKKVVKEVDEDEESDDEDLPPGLLERPVVLDEGRKRERKKTDRLETSFTTPGSKGKTMNIPEGSGTKLGDIDNVEIQLRKVHGEDLKHLHRVLYSRAGTTTEVKKNIRKFCGFAFAKNSPEYDKRVLVITKNTLAQLKLMCDTLDLERGGTKESIVERIIDFLMCPHPSDRKQKGENKVKLKRTPSGKERKRRRTKKEMEEARRQEAEDKASGKKRTNKRKAPSTDEDGEEEEEGESEGDGSGEEGEKEAEKEEEAPKTKKAKVESPKKETKKPKEVKKDVAEKKTSEKKAKSPKKQKPPVDSSEDSSDDETSSKKPPSDEELKEVVKKILDGANLEEITMKTVCRQVFDKYPAFDLSTRKDYIKSTVKQIIR